MDTDARLATASCRLRRFFADIFLLPLPSLAPAEDFLVGEADEPLRGIGGGGDAFLLNDEVRFGTGGDRSVPESDIVKLSVQVHTQANLLVVTP